MKAKDLYRVLGTELGPLLTARGFKKLRGSRLAFQRLVDGRYHTIWFQVDKWGWDPRAGSKFFVNFTVSASPDLDEATRREERLNFFLTDAELAQARALRDAVVARIPRPPAAYFETLEAQFRKSAQSAAALVDAVRSDYEPQPLPYQRHQDFGLRYWQGRDVVEWAALIAVVLPRAIDAMTTWSVAAK